MDTATQTLVLQLGACFVTFLVVAFTTKEVEMSKEEKDGCKCSRKLYTTEKRLERLEDSLNQISKYLGDNFPELTPPSFVTATDLVYDEHLRVIQEWKPTTGYDKLMEYVEKHWWVAERSLWPSDCGIYHLSTGGYSGNEEIVGAMMNNTMFWITCWQCSKRGGHYEFQIR